jgi:hypothetical protein
LIIDIIKINEIIVPIKINIAMKEKTIIKNLSLGSVMLYTSCLDEFISNARDLSIVYINFKKNRRRK